MTSMTDRARDRDRDAAIRTVDAALASGRIIQADRDKRVEEIRFASSLQDIANQVGDLGTPGASEAQAPAYVASPVAAVATAAPAAPSTAVFGGAPPPPSAYTTSVTYGPSQGGAAPFSALQTTGTGIARRIRGIVMGVVLVAVVLPVVTTIIAFVSSSRHYSFEGSSGSQPTDDTTYAPGQSPGPDGVNVLTADGFRALVSALQSRAGSTSVYSAVVYPRYAVLDVPDGTGAGHYTDYYWDGATLDSQDFKSSTDDETVDLTAVDPQVMIDQLAIVRGRVTDPNSWYCIAYHPAGAQDQIACYASNDYSDTSYTVVGLDGTTIYDSASQS